MNFRKLCFRDSAVLRPRESLRIGQVRKVVHPYIILPLLPSQVERAAVRPRDTSIRTAYIETLFGPTNAPFAV